MLFLLAVAAGVVFLAAMRRRGRRRAATQALTTAIDQSYYRGPRYAVRPYRGRYL